MFTYLTILIFDIVLDPWEAQGFISYHDFAVELFRVGINFMFLNLAYCYFIDDGRLKIIEVQSGLLVCNME